MNIKEFMENTPTIRRLPGGYTYQELRPQIHCNDGTTLSVQASETHYCTPRMNEISGYWNVEVGYPSVRPPKEWEQFFDGYWQNNWLERIWRSRKSIQWQLKKVLRHIVGKQKSSDGRLKMTYWYLRHLLDFGDNATNGVYGYVPVGLVQKFIDAHGGINIEKTFEEREEPNGLQDNV